jgi:chemotaxis protein methyltransferase CheR
VQMRGGLCDRRQLLACSDSDYAYLRELIRSQSANVIDPSRNSLVETRLTPVARQAGASNLEGLVRVLQVEQPAQLHRAVAEAMTINETSFFRDILPFEMLRRVILPKLIEARREERRLRIWSAASSTGQEAYSVAMLLAEHFPELASWDVKIVGTDISRHVIEYARAARFRRMEVNRGLPARMLVKYFTRHRDEWEINPAIRRMCEFQPVNLCGVFPALPVFDLVLLRNVLLYFPRQDRSDLFRTVSGRIAKDSFMILGNAEQAEDSTNLFTVEFAMDCYFYRPVGRG